MGPIQWLPMICENYVDLLQDSGKKIVRDIGLVIEWLAAVRMIVNHCVVGWYLGDLYTPVSYQFIHLHVNMNNKTQVRMKCFIGSTPTWEVGPIE